MTLRLRDFAMILVIDVHPTLDECEIAKIEINFVLDARGVNEESEWVPDQRMCRYRHIQSYVMLCDGVEFLCGKFLPTYVVNKSYSCTSMRASISLRPHNVVHAWHKRTGNGHAIHSECMCHIFYSYFMRTSKHNYARASRLASTRIFVRVFFRLILRLP